MTWTAMGQPRATADPVAEPYVDYAISVTMNTYPHVAPALQREAVDSLDAAPRPA